MTAQHTMTHAAGQRLDWKAIKPQVDLARVASGLFGPAPINKGKRLIWTCPFHDDRHPSLQVDVERQTWKCWPCGIGGDAIALVRQVRGVDFREAVQVVSELCGIATLSTSSRKPDARRMGATRPFQRSPSCGSHPPHKTCKVAKRTPDEPSGLPAAEAMALVEEAEHRLWTPEGGEARRYLEQRGLSDETIRRARLGLAENAVVLTRNGDRYFRTSGVTIPWFDEGRLALVKIRQSPGSKPSYIEAFRDRPRIYPGFDMIKPRRPLIIVEGEFDALVMGQDLYWTVPVDESTRTGVVTLGSAANLPDPATVAKLLIASTWFLALDDDPAGEKAVTLWPRRAQRVRPPEGFKDWTELKQRGTVPEPLRGYWSQYLN